MNNNTRVPNSQGENHEVCKTGATPTSLTPWGETCQGTATQGLEGERCHRQAKLLQPFRRLTMYDNSSALTSMTFTTQSGPSLQCTAGERTRTGRRNGTILGPAAREMVLLLLRGAVGRSGGADAHGKLGGKGQVRQKLAGFAFQLLLS
jgi:hypothetical protein